MSGHGDYIAVASRPVNNGNIGNIGNVQQPANANPQPLNVNEEEQPQVIQENDSTRELAKQLDVLL